MGAHVKLLLVKFGRGNFLRWVIYPSLIIFVVYRFVIAPELLNASSNNGFDLSNSEIPVQKIESSGPPRDGIPVINSPRFVSARDAGSFMQEGDRVIGLEIDGVTRAWPFSCNSCTRSHLKSFVHTELSLSGITTILILA